MTAPPPSSGSIANSAPMSILAYCASSILMTVTNKMVLSHFDFRMNFLLLSVQTTVAIVLLKVFKNAGLISFRRVDRTEAKKWFPISLTLVAMVYTGSKSLQYLSIPLYTIFKNLTIILIAYGEVLSSVIAGWSDLKSFAPSDGIVFNIGYFWMGLNCFSSAGYVLYMRKRIKYFNFKDFDTVYYNNILSLPVMLVLSLFLEGWTSGEFERTFSEDVRQALVVAMVLSGVSSFLISYGSAWCVRCTSSTTYSMIGALNKLPVAASGILFLGDPATAGNIFGILFGFIAGLLYSYSKTAQAQTNMALANGSSLSKPLLPETSASNPGDEALELTTPASLPNKSSVPPLYIPNPDGKVAD
ncbi:GDP-mannose transporter into the lumen of the Golgi [Linnemannia hyalina]|uniref:GDP-mannose transporter n=1 Tax=Linnemannia hyalina TaxID=64524 RepID=A0A9P7XRI6_9FUNG|nr:GDP-mannose transporter into the lumen of the Golgi [Linnemannia hyalina]